MEGKDVIETIPFVFDKGMYVAVGMLIVWLVKSGKLSEGFSWLRSAKKEIQEEAKEAPQTEVRMLREQLNKTDLIVTGLVTKYDEIQKQHHHCEVALAQAKAESAAEIKILKSQNEAQAKAMDLQLQRIADLERQLAEVRETQQREKAARIEGDAAKQ